MKEVWEQLQKEIWAPRNVSSLVQCFPVLGRVSVLDRQG